MMVKNKYKNYAEFREGAISKNYTEEKIIYCAWVKYNLDECDYSKIEPFLAEDSRFHFIYVSVRNDGMIYVGKHSTTNLNDGYQGSGTEVKLSKYAGYTFKTTPLYFFESEDLAFEAEANIVNASFLSSNLMLNKSLGGNGYPKMMSANQMIANRNIAQINHNISFKKSMGIQSFKSKGIPVGSIIKYKYKCKNREILAETVDEDNGVRYKGRKYTIYELTKELFRKYGEMEPRPNGYRYFTYNGVVIDKIK